MQQHIVQSKEWGEFKTSYKTPSVSVKNIRYTIHKIPNTTFSLAYCPKVDPSEIDFHMLKESLIKNKCIAVNFDVPNVIAKTSEEKTAVELFSKNNCKKSPRDQFAKYSVFLDLTETEDVLLSKMTPKHRYNIRYAQKKGVEVKLASRNSNNDFEIFYKLLKNTADRQKYYVHSKSYYKSIWDTLPENMCHILTAYYQNEPLASWMLFSYMNVLYYPYGGSSEKHKNLFASNLLGWESIVHGKNLGCELFDMWGASKDPEDKKDPWYGFTNFKLKFGGEHVQFMDSYDLVINRSAYLVFNLVNNLRWKILKAVR